VVSRGGGRVWLQCSVEVLVCVAVKRRAVVWDQQCLARPLARE